MTPTAAKRNITLLNTATVLAGFRAFDGVIAIFFASITGSFALGMTVLAIMNLSASVFEVPTGVLSDTVGRKKTINLYYLTGTIGTVLFFLAESTALLIAGAVFVGMSMAFRSGAVSAYIYENLETLGSVHTFKRVEGKRLALRRYALVCAGICGALIIYFIDIRTTVLVSGCFSFAALVVSLFLTDNERFEKRKANVFADLKEAWQGFLSDELLRDLSIGRMISRGVGNVEYRFRSLFYDSLLPTWFISILDMVGNLIVGIAMHTTHFIVERLGILRSMVHIHVLDRIISSILIVINTAWSAISLAAITSVSFGVREIAAEDLAQERYTKEQRATMGSLVSLGGTLIYGVTAIGVGILADYIGLMYTMLALQPLLLVATYFFYRGIQK